MDAPGILLDTDVIVNWLVQEVETASGRELWKAPLQIIKLAENKTVSAFISLTTLMELRYLLRRKKSCDIRKIEEDLSALTSVIDVIIPDEIALLRANSLQAEQPLDPFDAIHLSICAGLEPLTLVSRDSSFLRLSQEYVPAMTPEEYLDSLQHS